MLHFFNNRVVFYTDISCRKDEIQPKINSIIYWENPADISFGTLLSKEQLNATANVSGTFIFIPAIGTKLNIGNNQDLKVFFKPTDNLIYNATSKTVKINVTSTTGIITDMDNNVYNTITIGTQIWMAENLKTTKYNDGEDIHLQTENWYAISQPMYCWYNNDEAMYKDKYGALYSWWAVITDKLCPVGYHVPTYTEFTVLTNYLGGDSIAGSKLQEICGFAAPLGGYRNRSGFLNVGSVGTLWSSSATNYDHPWCIHLYYNDSVVYKGYGGPYGNYWVGQSVRCIKN